jgi:hypothetical protein
MLDILVAQVVLDGPCILTIIRQLESTAVTQHVRMDWKFDLGFHPCPGNQLPKSRITQWPTPFCHEHIGCIRVITL